MDFEKIDIPLVARLISLYKQAHRLILAFPKHERYALGEKIESNILSALEKTFSANNSNKYEKEKLLIEVNSHIELLKVLVRLSFDLNFIEQRQYLDTERIICECGKMTFGWIKYTRTLR